MNNNRNRISAIFMSIFIVISFFFMMGCPIVCAQENNETDTPLAVGVLLNKPDVTYDISTLEKFAEDGSVYIYKSDNVIMENVDNSNTGTFRSEEENSVVPGITYIYRSHFDSNLGVVIYGMDPSFFPGNHDDTEMNNLEGLVVNIVIPTKLEQVLTEWEQVTLELFYEVKVNESILEFMGNLGYSESGGAGSFGDFVGLYFIDFFIK